MRINFFYKWLMIFPFFIGLSFVKSQGKINEEQEIKYKIEQLVKENDIKKINQILGSNTSLSPEYIFKILNSNLEKARKSNDQKTLAETYFALGNFWNTRGDKVKAFHNYTQSESISRKNKDFGMLGASLRNKAPLLEDNNKKIALLNEAIEILSKTNDNYNLAITHLNTGVTYSSYVKIDSLRKLQSADEVSMYKRNAFKHYAIADSLNRTLKDNMISGAINTYYGEWFIYEENYMDAKKMYLKAEEFLLKAENIKGWVNSLLMIAYVEMKENNFEEALNMLSKAEKLSKNHQLNDSLVRIYNEYVNCYNLLGDYKKALEYYRLYNESAIKQTELSSQDKMQIISLEQNLSEQRYTIEKYEVEKFNNRILILATIVFALMAVIVSFLIVQNKKKKLENIKKSNLITEMEKSAVEIKLKNQLLEDELLREKIKFSQNNLINFANQVNKIDSFLDTLKNELKEILPREKQEKINSLKISFSEVLNNQSEIKQLNSLSSQLNQDFFFHLRKNYPNISKEDEQLLSYIILNMTPKEISHNLKISPESIYKKRYRLRKKLNLQNEDTFENFYQDITSKLN